MNTENKIHRLHMDNLIAKLTKEVNDKINSLAYDLCHSLKNIIIYFTGALITAHLSLRIKPHFIESIAVMIIIYILVKKIQGKILEDLGANFKIPFEYWIAKMSNIQKQNSKEYFEESEWQKLKAQIEDISESHKKILENEQRWIYTGQARNMIFIATILISTAILGINYKEDLLFFIQRIVYSLVFIICTNKFYKNFCVYKNAFVK